MKRKQPEPLQEEEVNTTPRKRKSTRNGTINNGTAEDVDTVETPSRRTRASANRSQPGAVPEPVLDFPTPRTRTRSLFTTPTKGSAKKNAVNGTPSRLRNADRSARRKSARVLFNPNEDDVWDGGEKLAQEIWDQEEDNDAVDDAAVGITEDQRNEAGDLQPAETPSRRRGGRPKGSRNKRSPTPEGNLPPHERYFFQNRWGPVQTSSNTLAKLPLLTHEEYFGHLEGFVDPHEDEKRFLLELHERSFPQWEFELSENFNICLYGYGSKRVLVNRFAEWLHQRRGLTPTIVMVNGYVPNTNLRSVLATIVSAVLGPDTPSKLGTQPAEVLEVLQSSLEANPPKRPIMVFINSIDGVALRRPAYQPILARLASLPSINLLATADTPSFSLMWDISLRDQFNFVFHDCTTFAPYEAELNVVDEVHSLFGRRARRVGGKEGVGFVLKSLPENTRKLYRLLITEILMLLSEQQGSEDEGAGDDGGGDDGQKEGTTAIEWRTLYHKAAEEFISSSEMMFRTQLKEFYDHQMITSRTDPSGVEMLGVPLSREEMEGVLEELVID